MEKTYVSKRPKKIGKPMMGALHIHKSAIDTLTEEQRNLVEEKTKYLSEGFVYDIIKIDIKNQEVAFTRSRDWNTADEPEVGERETVKADNTIVKREPSTQIYHHKWMFVKDDYIGFNVEDAKKRSEYWENHPHVVALKNDPNEKFRFKIGQSKYWEENVRAIIDK